MTLKRGLSLGSAALALAVPLPALAQSAPVYYAPPKLLTRGKSTTPVAGNGTVVVQVLVNKDGSFKVQRVVRSTNHGDDAAALEIAKTSKYQPASRGAVKQTAFYDFTLKFVGGSATAASGDSLGAGGGSSAGGEIRFGRMIRAGNYQGAKSGLEAYLQQHPGDQKAQADLGVANTFLSDYAAAAAAFDKAGSLSPSVKALAGKAYAETAAAKIKSNDTAAAVAAAKRAVEIAPSFYGYNTLGLAQSQGGDTSAAIAAFESARSLGAKDSKIKPKERALVDANLVSTYLDANRPDQAKAVAAEAQQLDPTQQSAQNAYANYYLKQAQAASKAGKDADAASLYEQAAVAVPAQAAALYAQAAVSYLNLKPKPDNDKAKADADKALAAAPDNAVANYAAGIALANQQKSKDALVYLNKADASAKSGNDTSLATAIENAIKQLNGTK